MHTETIKKGLRLIAALALAALGTTACGAPAPAPQGVTGTPTAGPTVAPTPEAMVTPAPTVTPIPTAPPEEPGAIVMPAGEAAGEASQRLAEMGDAWLAGAEAAVQVESGVTATMRVDMSDPQGRVAVDLEAYDEKGKPQAEDFQVRVGEETFANRADGVRLFWVKTEEGGYFNVATAIEVEGAMAYPRFDPGSDNPRDIVWVVTGEDGQEWVTHCTSVGEDGSVEVVALGEPEPVEGWGEEETEVEVEPLYWDVAMSKVIEGYQVEGRDGVVHTIPGYDMDHPVIDIVSSGGVVIQAYGQIGYFGNERPRLVSKSGDNTEMADNLVEWLGLVQKEYNQALGSSEGHSGAFITAIDGQRLAQLTGDESGPIPADRVLDNGETLMGEIPVAIADLSKIILLEGSFPEEGAVAEHNRYVRIALNNGGEPEKVAEVYNMITYQDNGSWGTTRIAFVYPDKDNPGKNVLLMIDRGYETGQFSTFVKVDGIIYGGFPTMFNDFFMPSEKLAKFTANALGGRGLISHSFDTSIKNLWDKTRYVRAMSTEYTQRDPYPLVLENWKE